ncbi:hypothetical protein KJ966_24435 [bacterium]|nr:hypothetical protein [bacterium]
MEETQVDNLVFKGYIIIDDIIYGIITIGDSDYEVLEGDEIKGFRILNISNIGLDYFHNQRKYHSTLDSQ